MEETEKTSCLTDLNINGINVYLFFWLNKFLCITSVKLPYTALLLVMSYCRKHAAVIKKQIKHFSMHNSAAAATTINKINIGGHSSLMSFLLFGPTT